MRLKENFNRIFFLWRKQNCFNTNSEKPVAYQVSITPANEHAVERFFLQFFFRNFDMVANASNTSPISKILSPIESWESQLSFGATPVSQRCVKMVLWSNWNFGNFLSQNCRKRWIFPIQITIQRENSWFFKIIFSFFEFWRAFEHASLRTFTHRQKPRPTRMESWESQLSTP